MISYLATIDYNIVHENNGALIRVLNMKKGIPDITEFTNLNNSLSLLCQRIEPVTT